MRVVRRPRGSQRRSLTAAAQLIENPQKAARNATMGAVGRADWQNEVWDFVELVGELAYWLGWRANSCSRVRLVASEIDPESGLPTGGISEEAGREGERVMEIVKAIAGGPLGQAELIKRAAELLSAPGEMWLAILMRDDGEHWFAVSREEWKAKSTNEMEIELPDGEKHTYVPGTDRFIRIWNPRARRAKEATSPVRGALDPLREIVRTTKKIKVADKSRLIGNGVVFLPAEMSLPAAQQPIPEDQPGAPMPVVQGVPAADQLANLIYQQAVAAIEDDDSQSAVVPLLATVPGEHLGKIFHLKISDDVTEVELKKRNDAIARLAMALDVSPERLLGVGSTTNHWSAWQVGDEDVQLHIKPVMQTICQAINDKVLKKVFEAEGIDTTKYMLWFDASQLTADPDLTDEAVEAHDRGAITSAQLRRLLNVGEDAGYDLTTFEGCQEFAVDVVTKNPELIATYAPLLSPDIAELDFPQPVAIGDGKAQPGQDADEVDQEEPDTEDDQDDNTASARVMASAAEMILAERLLVTRALDLAGKRRVKVNDRVLKARLVGVPAHEYHRRMPPVNEAEIPRLIAGWDNGLEDEVIARLGVDTEALRESVRRQVRMELTRPLVDAEVV
jgi:hypothetical protein